MDQEMNKAVEEQGAETMDMATALEQFEVTGRLHKNEIVKGTVVGETDSAWLVDVGYKCAGTLPFREWSHRIFAEDSEKPQKGDEIEVQVISIRKGEEAALTLSRWRHELDKRWSELVDLSESQKIFTVKGLRKVKGGIMAGCCGLEGFIPLSHLTENGRNADLDKFIGREFEAELIEHDRRKHRIVFSRRAFMDNSVWYDIAEKFPVGSDIKVKVVRLADFGAFVEVVKGVEALIRISHISTKSAGNTGEVLHEGQEVVARVIELNPEQRRMSLSLIDRDELPVQPHLENRAVIQLMEELRREVAYIKDELTALKIETKDYTGIKSETDDIAELKREIASLRNSIMANMDRNASYEELLAVRREVEELRKAVRGDGSARSAYTDGDDIFFKQ